MQRENLKLKRETKQNHFNKELPPVRQGDKISRRKSANRHKGWLTESRNFKKKYTNKSNANIEHSAQILLLTKMTTANDLNCQV